jgi:hypothetical protein
MFVFTNPSLHQGAPYPEFTLIYNKNQGIWESVGLNISKHLIQTSIGLMVDGADRDYGTIWYQNSIKQNASIITPAGAFLNSTLEKDKGRTAMYFVRLARDNEIQLFIHPAFSKYDIDYLKDVKDKTSLIEAMQRRASRLIAFAKEARGSSDTPPAIITIYNEPIARYYTNPNTAKWKDDENIFYQYLGADMLVEAYLVHYEEALKAGLTPGKDVVFIVNEYGIHTQNPKTEFLIREFPRIKERIAQRLDISPYEVKVGLGIEMRFDKNNPHDYPIDRLGRFNPKELKDLPDVLQRLSQVFEPIYFTEVNYANSSWREKTDLFIKMLEIANEYNVAGIVFEAPYRFNRHDLYTYYENAYLFSPEREPTAVYYALLQKVLSLATER